MEFSNNPLHVFSVWDMQTGKCMRSFRHKHPVMAVAMSEETCITGCDGGRVKVWDLNTGELIKVSVRDSSYYGNV